MQIDINSEVQSALPGVLEKMRQSIASRVEREAESVAMDEIRKAVREWTTAALVPEVIAQLDAGKSSIAESAAGVAKGIGKALEEAMVEQAKKALASSYMTNEIAEKLFRGY